MTNEELNTLIDALKRKATFFRRTLNYGQNETEILLTDAAKALTDLRTERDALAAVVEKARAYLRDERWDDPGFDPDAILATAPMSALADRDARILEEAANDLPLHAPFGFAKQAQWLRDRAASRRREGGAV